MSSARTDQIDVRYVANLARIDLSEEECVTFQEQLDAIIGYIDTLKDIDLEAVENSEGTCVTDAELREDKSRPGLCQQDLLVNAPDSAMGQIRVPKVVDA